MNNIVQINTYKKNLRIQKFKKKKKNADLNHGDR